MDMEKKKKGGLKQSNQVVGRSVKHKHTYTTTLGRSQRSAETLWLCFFANCTSNCVDDSATTLQSTVREISQQPQFTDTYSDT